MTQHELKCWPSPFAALLTGAKKAEFRRDDRGYQAGDSLLLKEWDPNTRRFTGQEISRVITHVSDCGVWAPNATGYVELSLGPDLPEGNTPRDKPALIEDDLGDAI